MGASMSSTRRMESPSRMRKRCSGRGLEEGRDRRFPLSRSEARLPASYLVMWGASMKSVQEHLGHTSLAMTERYSHLSPEYMRSELERLNGLCMVGMDEADSKK